MWNLATLTSTKKKKEAKIREGEKVKRIFDSKSAGKFDQKIKRLLEAKNTFLIVFF